jgi:tetratricopeptide (TPR) repeat protein
VRDAGEARAGALTAQVLAWSRQRGEIELTARALLLMGDLLRAAGQSAEASAAYSEAEAIFDDFGDAHGRARCLLGRGLVERAVGRAEEARGRAGLAVRVRVGPVVRVRRAVPGAPGTHGAHGASAPRAGWCPPTRPSA